MKRALILLSLLVLLMNQATAQSEGANVTLNGSNNPPVIAPITSISSQNPTQNGNTTVACIFIATDANTKDDMNASTADCSFSKSGEALRNGATCSQLPYYQLNTKLEYINKTNNNYAFIGLTPYVAKNNHNFALIRRNTYNAGVYNRLWYTTDNFQTIHEWIDYQGEYNYGLDYQSEISLLNETYGVAIFYNISDSNQRFMGVFTGLSNNMTFYPLNETDLTTMNAGVCEVRDYDNILCMSNYNRGFEIWNWTSSYPNNFTLEHDGPHDGTFTNYGYNIVCPSPNFCLTGAQCTMRMWDGSSWSTPSPIQGQCQWSEWRTMYVPTAYNSTYAYAQRRDSGANTMELLKWNGASWSSVGSISSVSDFGGSSIITSDGNFYATYSRGTMPTPALAKYDGTWATFTDINDIVDTYARERTGSNPYTEAIRGLYPDISDGTKFLMRIDTQAASNSTLSIVSLTNGAGLKFSCPVQMLYYDAPGTWTINASIKDLSDATGYSDSESFTYNTLTAMESSPGSLTFGTLVVGQTSGAVDDPLIISNQGNVNLTNMTVLSYDLLNHLDVIGAQNFRVSTVDSGGTGGQMANASYIQVPDAFADRGAGSSESLYMWVTVPAVQAATYDSHSNWVVAVFT